MHDEKKADVQNFFAEKDGNQFQQINNSESENQIQPSNNESEKTNHSHAYRPDIDGLRAIAVAIVVIFHAWPTFMPGGFIGVDVFFVISGYLISGIIIKQSYREKFSFSDFYIRRVKRIYPALIVVLICTLVLACKYYIPRHLQIMTKTLAASTVFGANIEVLTYQKGYFDPQTKVNPLLHLWSLGVEQQFYIIWPLLLFFTIKLWRRKTFAFLTIFTIISFILNVFIVYSSPKFSFYFPICRFWQMAIGGMIAYRKIIIQNVWIATGLSGMGLAGILITIWFLDEQSLFPGFWALIPTLAGVFIIQAGMNSYINSYILSFKPIVFIGKISYPLYLWHWPLLVILRYLYPAGSKFIMTNTFLVVAIAVVASILTYYLVEERIRYRKQKIVWMLLLVAMILIGVTSLVIHNNATWFEEKLSFQDYEKAMIPGEDDYYVKNGKKLPNSSINKNRQLPTLGKIKVSKKQPETSAGRLAGIVLQKKIGPQSKYYRPGQNVLDFYEVANEGKENTLFIAGDSHAQFVSFRFGKLYEDSVKRGDTDKFPTIVLMLTEAVAFLPCTGNYNFIMSMIRQQRPKRVLFIVRYLGHWKTYLDCRHNHKGVALEENLRMVDADIVQIKKIFKELKDLGIDVYVNSPSPEGKNYDPERMVDLNGVIEENVKPIILSEFLAQNKPYIERFQNAMNEIGVKLVYFSDHQCWEDKCQVLSPSGYAVFRDDNHHSKIYSRYWASSLDFLTEF